MGCSLTKWICQTFILILLYIHKSAAVGGVGGDGGDRVAGALIRSEVSQFQF